MPKRFYITTAIDYTNASPHMGHLYEKIITDCIARWHRLKGEEVFFLTGTDEHGQKVENSALKVGKKPKQFVDELVKDFKKLLKVYNISNDHFVRTTDKSHVELSTKVFKKVFDKGDIYKGKYAGYYCTGCEAYYTDRDLIKAECPIHKRKVDWVEEDSYFFKMSKYEKDVIKFLSQKGVIIPEFRRKEMLNRVKAGLKDLSVSRASFKWGIPLPNDKDHVIYVWFDALLNYISGVHPKHWPADTHVIGKDILWFHSVIWPAILKAAGYEMPKNIFVHGFVNIGGEKLSKSRGIMVDPFILAEKYPIDAVKYFLLKEIPAGQDGDFSDEALKTRLNNELANDLGNLVNRVVVMINKYFDGELEGELDQKLLKKSEIFEKADKNMNELKINKTIEIIWNFVKQCNVYINEKEPWKIKEKDELGKVLLTLAESLRRISIYLEPFIPETVGKIRKQLNLEEQNFKDLNKSLKAVKTSKPEILFKKIE